jgi:acid phosphatase type 7
MMNPKTVSILASCFVAVILLAAIQPMRAASPPPTGEVAEIWEQAPISRLTVPLAAETPEIDGQTEDTAWERAAVARGFVRARAPQADPEQVSYWGIEGFERTDIDTRVGLLYDDEHLFLAFTCREPYMHAIRAAADERDGNVHQDDAVGIVLMFEREGEETPRIVQIWVNTENVVRDADNTRDETEWQLEGLRSDVSREDDAWHIELAIPFAGLDVEPPQQGDVWRINLVRERFLDHDRHRRRMTWSGQIEDPLNLPGRMAEIRFGEQLLVEARLQQPFLGTDLTSISVRNDSDHPRRLTAQVNLVSTDADEQTLAEGEARVGPGEQASIDLDYAIQTEGTGILYVVVRDPEADDDEALLLVERRPFHVRPLATEIDRMVELLEEQLREQGDDWELAPQVRKYLPWLQSLQGRSRQIIDQHAGQMPSPQARGSWDDLERSFHRFVQETGWFEPEALYLTWQRDPATTMTIHWQSLRPFDHRMLQYRRQDQDHEDEPEPWQTRRGWGQRMPFSERMNHVVELAGLEPDTGYLFRFGPGLAEYRFRTMPLELDRPIRIVVGGDTMHQRAWFEQMTRQAMAFDPDFVMIGGDLAYADGRADTTHRWVDWLEVVTQDLRGPDGRLVPLLVAIGNHEVRGSWHWAGGSVERAPYFYSLFSMPGQAGYNVLDFGGYLSVVLLDSDHSTPVDGPQAEWLGGVLRQRQGRHILPMYHVPGYPSHRSFDGRTSRRIRDRWVPLFEEFGVRMAFENHDHTYKRTPPLRGGEVSEDGIVYLGDGAWGVGVRSIHSVDETEYLAAAESVRHVLLVTVEGETIHAQALNIDGEVFDEVTVERIRRDRSAE